MILHTVDHMSVVLAMFVQPHQMFSLLSLPSWIENGFWLYVPGKPKHRLHSVFYCDKLVACCSLTLMPKGQNAGKPRDWLTSMLRKWQSISDHKIVHMATTAVTLIQL